MDPLKISNLDPPSISFFNNLQIELLSNKKLLNATNSTEEKIAKKAITRAIASIIPDYHTAYLTGEKKISKIQIKQISLKIDEFKNQISERLAKRMKKAAKKSNRLMAMTSRLRDTPAEISEKMRDFYQIAGCLVSYGAWKIGDTILGPDKQLSDYTVRNVIKNKKGLQIVVLVPKNRDDKNATPILCCRGTTADLHNILDDAHPRIGAYSYDDETKEAVRDEMSKLAAEYGPVLVTGHSLGGAVATRIHIDFCDQMNEEGTSFLKETHSFGAPGVGGTAANEYDAKRSEIPEDRRPKVIIHRNKYDIVPLAGGKHIHADEVIHYKDDSTNFRSLKKVKELHCWTKLCSELRSRVVREVSLPRAALNKITEFLRRVVSRIAIEILSYSIQQEEQLKDAARRLANIFNATLHIPFEI